MYALIAAVVLVGVLCLVDLVLTIGVVRRLREHTQLLANHGGPKASIGTGAEVGEFHTLETDGTALDRSAFDGPTIVGFFSTTCRPCREKLPDFVEFARHIPGGRSRVLAVVVGDVDTEPFTSRLTPVARLVVEPDPSAPVCRAFAVAAFPSVLMVEPDGEGTPVVRDEQVDLSLPAGVPA